MPSVSRRQQRYLYAKFGSAWVHQHGFDVLDPSARKKPSQHRRKNMRTTDLTRALAR